MWFNWTATTGLKIRKQIARPMNHNQCETALPPGDRIEAKGRKQSRSRGIGIRWRLVRGTYRESRAFVFERRMRHFLFLPASSFYGVSPGRKCRRCLRLFYIAFVHLYCVWRIICKPNITHKQLNIIMANCFCSGLAYTGCCVSIFLSIFKIDRHIKGDITKFQTSRHLWKYQKRGLDIMRNKIIGRQNQKNISDITMTRTKKCVAKIFRKSSTIEFLKAFSFGTKRRSIWTATIWYKGKSREHIHVLEHPKCNCLCQCSQWTVRGRGAAKATARRTPCGCIALREQHTIVSNAK